MESKLFPLQNFYCFAGEDREKRVKPYARETKHPFLDVWSITDGKITKECEKGIRNAAIFTPIITKNLFEKEAPLSEIEYQAKHCPKYRILPVLGRNEDPQLLERKEIKHFPQQNLIKADNFPNAKEVGNAIQVKSREIMKENNMKVEEKVERGGCESVALIHVAGDQQRADNLEEQLRKDGISSVTHVTRGKDSMTKKEKGFILNSDKVVPLVTYNSETNRNFLSCSNYAVEHRSPHDIFPLFEDADLADKGWGKRKGSALNSLSETKGTVVSVQQTWHNANQDVSEHIRKVPGVHANKRTKTN